MAPKARAPPLRHAPIGFVLTKRMCFAIRPMMTGLHHVPRGHHPPMRGVGFLTVTTYRQTAILVSARQQEVCTSQGEPHTTDTRGRGSDLTHKPGALVGGSRGW